MGTNANTGKITTVSLASDTNVQGVNLLDASAITSNKMTLIGSAGADSIVGGGRDDAITGGSGVDTLTGGDGKDTFTFALNDSGKASATTPEFDTITDFIGDVVSFGSLAISQFKSSVTAASGVAGVSSSGVVTFDGADGTFAKHVAAVANAIGASSAGNALCWTEGSDTYVFVSDGTVGLTSSGTDVIIKLTGVAGVSLGLTNGTITSFNPS